MIAPSEFSRIRRNLSGARGPDATRDAVIRLCDALERMARDAATLHEQYSAHIRALTTKIESR